MSTVEDRELADALAALRETHAETARLYPGDSGSRQPVHTVYGGAQIFKRDTAGRLGAHTNTRRIPLASATRRVARKISAVLVHPWDARKASGVQ